VWQDQNRLIYMRLGLDPTGGTNVNAGTVQWTPRMYSHRRSTTEYSKNWTQFAKRVVAQSTNLTVFIHMKGDGVQWHLYGVDDCALTHEEAAFTLMVLLLNIFAKAFPATVTRIFGRAQVLSAAWMAFSHGSNDAQKTMGVMTMAVASYLHWGGSQWVVPLWIIVGAALAMGLGTSIGGWRIIRTIGLRVVQLRPIHGFAAETAAATIIEAASRLGIPVSTTHTISSAILGVGSTRRLSAVRWGIAGQIVLAWVFTIPACFILAWAVRSLLGFMGA